MPDVATSPDATLPFVEESRLYALQNLLCCSYLIRSHHQQLFIHIEHTIFGQYVQNGILGKESRSKVTQVSQQVVFLVAPVRSKLKRIAIHLVFTLTTNAFLLFRKASCVAVVFGFCAVTDDKHLHIVKHSFTCPEAVTQITVYLVKSLLDRHTPTLQFYVHQRQTID